jgi:hypothetical protein
MIFSKPILFALVGLLTTAVDSFVVTSPSASAVSATSYQPKTSTCLRAEEDNETGTEAEVVASTAGNDILNSPAFLKRKVDVLKSDIEKADLDIAAAQELAEAGKAEWGPQLEALQLEVSFLQLLKNRCVQFTID